MPGIARLGDSVAGPYVATITSCSGTTHADNIGVARIGDSTFGTCPLDHSGAKGIQVYTGSGVIISGSGTTHADNIGVARLGDSVLPGCGHVSTIVSASGTTYAD